ncbi:MAG: hypothetical protein LBM75_02980 [Myxococcales bacterium]|jgi:hypothetical protein|nr:hypothetical protein [Myxococcales bacterium]
MDKRMNPVSAEKRAILESFLEHGPAMLHLDARQPGVRVPPWLQGDLQLRLSISPRFDPPDLLVDEWGVRQTLSFQGRRFPVALPWNALFGLGDARGELRLFPASIPFEIFEAIAATQGMTREELQSLQERSLHEPGPNTISFSPTDRAEAPPPPRPQLRAIQMTPTDAPSQADDDEQGEPIQAREVETPEGKAARRAHLRVVK